MRSEAIRRAAVLSLALALLASGCERGEGGFSEERSEAAFQSAMADYTAGRLDAAVSGFEKAVKANPGNASARFQLAYLLQDHRHDYLGALCNYREYLMQAPDSDKEALARKRMDICERLAAAELAKKLNLSDNAAVAAENERLKVELKDLTDRNAELGEDLRKASARVASLEQENAKVRKMVGGIGREDGRTAQRPSVDVTNASLLDENEGTARIDAGRLKEFRDDEAAENAGTARPTLPKAVAAEGDAEGATTNVLAGVGGEARKASQSDSPLGAFGIMGGKSGRKDAKTAAAKRPETYVVKEGDTLYRIALEFYGRRDAWKRIRDANPLKISTDCKVRAGDVLRLP